MANNNSLQQAKQSTLPATATPSEMGMVNIISQSTLLGHEIDVYGSIDNPIFLASDVAEWIEHSNVTEMLKPIDEDEKLTSTLFRAGQIRTCNFLTENGLYEVLMLSRKPQAKQFKTGVKEILRTIRKTGGYIAAKAEDTPEEIMARALLVAQDTLRRREERIAMLQQENATQQEKIEQDAPKVLFAEAVSTSKTSILIGELAKVIKQNGVDMGQNRLFKWLRSNGYLCRHGEHYNAPTQKAMDMGLFEIKEHSVLRPDGSVMVTRTTKVTGKGQVYFVNKFLKRA